jgi:mannitol-1-phosphate/altronate dehydrogenase
MYLLQAVATTSTKEYLLQYGVLGLVAFVLGYFAWMQYQRLVKKNDQLEEKVDKLQEQMMILLVEERDRLSELIRENTQALAELQKTILKYIVKGSKD